jgi:3-isopropylmalate/(R)-2-methylmalate dehydratase small subunit
LPQAAIDRLMAVAKTDPIDIVLDTQSVTTRYQDRFTFEIDPFRKHCLLEGLDEVGLTMKQDRAITAHELRARAALPFLAEAQARAAA